MASIARGSTHEHTKRCAAVRALADVDREHPAQALRPGHGGPDLRPRGLGVVVHWLGRRPGHDGAAMACVGGEQTMKSLELLVHELGKRGAPRVELREERRRMFLNHRIQHRVFRSCDRLGPSQQAW
jgi:hypothetical protein